MYKYLLSLLGCLLCCCGCQEEIGSEAVNGSLNIQLTDGAALTRILPSALSDELQQLFQIELLRDKDGKDVQEYNGLLKDFGNQRTLRVGTYKLRASYGENKQLALDEPYYYGDIRDVLIEAHKAHSVKVTCGVANSLATFVIVNKEVFDKRMKEYYVAVSVGSTSVTWKPGDTTHPYFKTGSRVEFILKGISLESGQECTYALNPIEEVDAGMKYNYKLTMKSSASVGGIFDIVTEAHPEPIAINETVPDSWLPKPKIASNDFDAVGLLTYTETADAVPAEITYSAVRPVQEVEFELNFADVNLASLNKTYQLSSLSAEERTALENAGIQLSTWDGTSINGKLNFTSMTSGMLTQNGGQDVNNRIKVKAKANDRWSDEATYTIKTVKPVFLVEVREGNVWTKEFQIDEISVVAGSQEKISNHIQYQYSDDEGNTWQACNDRIKRFASRPDNRNYKVRAMYRDILSEVVDVILEDPMQIPNSGMEDWYYESLIKNKSVTYFPYQQNGTSYWNTNNSFTTRYRDNTLSKPYNCFPAVSYTKEAYTGMHAAELRNSAAGRGNTWFIGHTELEMNRVPGELFIGDITVTTGGTAAAPSGDCYTISRGKAFSSRPTSVHFWYQYAPIGTDEWKVYVALYDENKHVIIENTSTCSCVQSSYAEYAVALNYQEGVYYEPCKYICVIFSSTTTSGSTLPYETKTVKLWLDNSINEFKNTFAGSTLLIDDISLIYDK